MASRSTAITDHIAKQAVSAIAVLLVHCVPLIYLSMAIASKVFLPCSDDIQFSLV